MDYKRYVFFRDDDVQRLDERFLSFFKLFMKNKIPIVYGIIPGRIDNKCARFLLNQKIKNPDLIDLAQHGWSHKNYSDKNINKFEFGPGRVYIDQKIDIINGFLKMHELFGRDFSKIFIPPFHSYNFDTLKIINFLSERGNLNIFSAGSKTIQKEKKFIDLPASINFLPSQNNKKNKYVKRTLALLKKLFQNNSTSGILFHHDKYDAKDMEAIDKFLKYLKNLKTVSTFLPSKILKNKKNNKIDLTIEVTNRCNLHCKVCDIWREKPKKFLSFKETQQIFLTLLKSYSIGSVSLTGGEPFLNPELAKIVSYLTVLKKTKKIDSIGIYTNGFAVDKIIHFFSKYREFADIVELGISLDGNASNHNYLRGNPLSYRNIEKLLNEIELLFPKLNISLKFTISKINYKDLLKVYYFCRKRKLGFFPKFVEFNTSNYYHRWPKKHNINFLLNRKQSNEVKVMLKKIGHTEKEYRNKIVDISCIDALINYVNQKESMLMSCFVPLYSIFISHKGDVFPCLYAGPIANIFEKAWLDKIMGSDHIKIITDGMNLTCHKCFAYHGYLKNLMLY